MKIKNLLKPDNWWIIILSGVIAYMLFMIYSEPEYNKAFNFILPGLTITFLSTFISFIIALFLGLISGIGRISKNKFARTISRTYIEFIRGVPVLILIFTIAFVVVVRAAEFFNINNGNVPMLVRAIIGLNKKIKPFRIQDDFSANFSGYTVAMVLGVISEKIKMTMVRITEPTNTLPPK